MRYFLDTEFDGFGGPLMSLALVREDRASIYHLVTRPKVGGKSDPWVTANVVPILLDCPIQPLVLHPAQLGHVIADFLAGDDAPVIVTDWPADIRYFCEVIEFPEGRMAAIPGLTFELHRVDAYPTTLPGAVQHNAWWDAMALRQLFLDREKAAA